MSDIKKQITLDVETYERGYTTEVTISLQKKKNITDVNLALTQAQNDFLYNGQVSAAGLGISKTEFKRWQKDLYFAIHSSFSREYDLDDFKEVSGIQAATLSLYGYTYAEIESALDLECGKVQSWTTDGNSDFLDVLSHIKDRIKQTDSLGKNREKWEKWDAMIPLILAGKNNTEIATALGVTRQTILNWRKDEDFKIDINEEIRLYREAQSATLAKLHDKTYEVLHELLASKDESIRLKAAVEILKNTQNR